MKYLLLIYTEENSYAEGEREQCYAESTTLTHELKKQGKYLGCAPLHPVASATITMSCRSSPRPTLGMQCGLALPPMSG